MPPNTYITATATDPDGNTSEFARCITNASSNDAWPFALDITGVVQPVQQFVDMPGQSRWYKFLVNPGSKVIVSLENLPADYNLTIYKDIWELYQELNAPQDNDDLTELAGSVYAGSLYGFGVQSRSLYA